MSGNKNHFLILFIVFLCSGVLAQTTTADKDNPKNEIKKKKKDKATLYLKNGSVIHGILEQNDDIVVVKTRDGNVFAYQQTDIEQIELNAKPTLKNGSFHQFGFGTSVSETEFNGAFSVINGYQLSSKVYFGFGVGIERYYQTTYVPLFLDVQYYPFSDWSSRPFISVNSGKLMMHRDEKNGWLSGVKLGFAHALGNKVDIVTTIGYRHGVIERAGYYNPWDSSFPGSFREYEINRLEVGLGFMIK